MLRSRSMTCGPRHRRAGQRERLCVRGQVFRNGERRPIRPRASDATWLGISAGSHAAKLTGPPRQQGVEQRWGTWYLGERGK
jgi:hypothetical protein